MDNYNYNVITTVDITQQNSDGTTMVIPAGSVINTIIWDGVTEFIPPKNTTLEIGMIYNPVDETFSSP
jgi:hypothetical protein